MFLTQVAHKTTFTLLGIGFLWLVLPCYGQQNGRPRRLSDRSHVVPAAIDGRLNRTVLPQLTRPTPGQITIDEDILAVFVDEPCDHFQRARDTYLAGDAKVSAKELRTAAAYLRLEAARATPEGHNDLESSIRELQQLADAVENHQVPSVQRLERAFARAHLALANHYCLNSARRGCQTETLRTQQDRTRARQDLKAAVANLRHGLRWTGDVPDVQLGRTLDTSQTTAGRAGQPEEGSPTELMRVVQSLRAKLEELTGRKIMLAQPPAKQDPFGASVFR